MVHGPVLLECVQAPKSDVVWHDKNYSVLKNTVSDILLLLPHVLINLKNPPLLAIRKNGIESFYRSICENYAFVLFYVPKI